MAIKSENWISATVRIPTKEAPAAAPIMAASEIGVSMTRSGPNSSYKPRVTAKAPPVSYTHLDVYKRQAFIVYSPRYY